MATCYISEYTSVGAPSGSMDLQFQAPAEPAFVEQNVAISASSTQSAIFSVFTRLVRVHVDSVCSVLFGPNPTAVTTAKRLAANQTEYFFVQPGHRMAVITNV